MNTKSKLTLSLGLLLAPLALVAKTPEKAYVDAYRGRTDIPAPIAVVTPVVEPKFAGQQVTLEFVVDTAGQPTSITSVTPGVDADLVAVVTSAVAQWKFSPAKVNGAPVAKKVILPVNIVESFANAAVAMK